MNYKFAENVKRNRERGTVHGQFGKEVAHCRPRIWVRLPVNSETEIENCYIDFLKIVYKVTIQRQNIITKIFFFLYEPSLDMS